MSLFRFVARRVFTGVITVLIASLVLFALVALLPGDEVRGLFGFGPVDEAQMAEIREALNLDRPFLVQWWLFLVDFVTLDFGETMRGAPVKGIIRASLPVSGTILLGVLVLQVLLAPALVWLAGMRHGTRVDQVADTAVIVLVSIPALVAGFVVQAIFVYWTDLFPSPIWQFSDVPAWQNYTMPILALGLGSAAHLAMVGRVELLAGMSQPWIRAARAMGMPREHIVRIDALRPAAGSMVQLLGANMALLVTGLIVVEDVFEVQGLGTALLDAIQDQDRVVILSLVMLVLMGVIFVNTVTDLVHGWLDPRVRDGVL